jgi:hypothetical protein
MLFELGGKLLERLSSGAAQDKEIAQRQLEPILELRLQPCLELWKVLWKAADELTRLGADPAVLASAATDQFFQSLAAVVDQALVDVGGLVSWDCFRALLQLQTALRADASNEVYRRHKAKEVMEALVGRKDAPGLLVLLRDQIGSNSRSATSVLG